MKTLRVTMQFCLALCLLLLTASVASASTLTLTGNLHFPALDGSAQDSDGLANGTFTVSGDLVLDGTIHCNDVQPLPQNSGACPIRISVAGDLTLEPGSGIFAENRRGNGNGGNIRLEVGGDLTLRGPEASLPGAVVSTSQLLGTSGTAGNLTAVVVGAVDLQAGSVLAANSKSGSAGAISVTGDAVLVAGLVVAGPSQTLLSTPLSGEVLADGSVGQAGGTIHLRALGASEPGLRIESGGIVVSQGEGSGGRLILLEACGIEVRGLVASLSRNNGPSQVVLRSGKGIMVDGRDLGSPLPAEGRFGRIRADGTQQGAAGYLVDLFANSDIQILGPEPSSGQGLFAVTSRPGDQPLRNAGGTITAISLSGALTATGNALETGRDVQGDKGGVVDLQARGDVMLDGATIWAVGSFTSTLSPNARAGGHIDVRSFQGAVSWTFGVGDVRPTGTGVALARRGTIEITACSTVDITGTQFPVSGSAVAPFPVETEGICSPAAPSLPADEPALPVCAPANQPPAPTGGPFSVPENSPNGTVVGTVVANDPDAGQSHTFSITSGNTDGAFAIDSAGQITVADSTKIDFETTPSFTLTVQATDNGTPSQSGTGTVIVNLTDVNDPPKPSGGPFTIPEDSPNGTNVGAVAANDQDAGQTHTFSITNGNINGAFAIGLTTGQITVANSAALNYEAITSFSLTVEVTDSGSLTASTTVTVDLLNVPEAPVAVDEGTPASPYVETVGNTLLEVAATPGDSEEVRIVFHGNVLTNDFDPDGPAAFTASLESATAGAVVTVNPDGTFTYVPPPGFTGVDSFTYRATGSDGQSDTATVYINVEHRVWYVKNNAEADGLGRSIDPFDTLAEAEAASQAGDTIYLFAGNGATTGQSDGIVLKSGQRLIGEAVQLAAPVAVNINGVDGPTLRSTTGNKPKIENDNAPDAPGEDNGVSVPATAGNMTGVEIRGLEISGFDNAIDVTATGTNNASVTIHDNVISGANFEGIDVTAASTGTVTLAIHDNALTTTGTAIDVQRTAGTVYVTAFDDNAVSGDTAGTGINISGAIFDALPGSSFDTVSGGVTVIGSSGNGVGQSGLLLVNMQGDLSFTDLDVFADGGAGLRLSGTGAFNAAGATGTRTTVGAGVGVIEAVGGPAVDVSNATIDLRLFSLRSTNTTSKGVSLTNISDGSGNAVFSAGGGSSITTTVGASGPAFNVSGGNAAITYAGTITNYGGRAVSVDGWSGDDAGDDLLLSGAIDENGMGILLSANGGSGSITFSGGMDIDTGTNEGFAAISNTNGGGLHITGINTVDTTTATALRITNTPIGNSGLTFRSITSGTGSGSNGVGVVLDSTGIGASNGGLTVTGNSGPGTGGTIQRKTGTDGSTTSGIGIFLNSTKNVSLNWMQLNDFDNSAITGRNVQGFTLQNSVINGTIGTTNVGAEGPIAFGLSNPGGVNGLQGAGLIRNTKISGGIEHNLEFYNQSGSMSLTIAGLNAVSEGANPNSPADDSADCIIEENSAALGGDGIQVEMQGTSTASVVIDRCLFRDNKSQAVQVSGLNNSSTTVTIDESWVRRFDQGNEGFILQNGGDADLTARVSNNHISGFGGTAIFTGQVAGNATASSELHATISGNVITQPTTATNHAIIAFLTSTLGQLSQARVLIDGNTITNNSTSGTTRGIIVDTPDTGTSPVFHATVTNNMVSVGDNVAGAAGIVVQGRQSANTCASIGSNTVTFPNGNPGGVSGLRARQTGSAAYNLEQSPGCTGSAAAVLACRNPGSTTEVLGTLTVVPTGACLLPNTP